MLLHSILLAIYYNISKKIYMPSSLNQAQDCMGIFLKFDAFIQRNSC
jgi:hypothetical protein